MSTIFVLYIDIDLYRQPKVEIDQPILSKDFSAIIHTTNSQYKNIIGISGYFESAGVSNAIKFFKLTGM